MSPFLYNASSLYSSRSSLPDLVGMINLGILSYSEHLLLLLTIPCTRRWLMCTIRPRKLSINRDFSNNISARIKLCRDDLGRHILLQRTAYCYIYNCRHQCWSSWSSADFISHWDQLRSARGRPESHLIQDIFILSYNCIKCNERDWTSLPVFCTVIYRPPHGMVCILLLINEPRRPGKNPLIDSEELKVSIGL